MSRGWKYVVLIAGLCGIAGFFAPFLEYRAPDGTLTGASGYDIVTGAPDVSSLMSKAQQLGLVDKHEAARATMFIQRGLEAYRGAMIACFVPAALLLLVGLTAFTRRQMGRIAGLLAIVFGVGCALVYVIFFQVDQPSSSTTGQLGLGIYLLLVGGLLGILGGLGAVLAPDLRD